MLVARGVLPEGFPPSYAVALAVSKLVALPPAAVGPLSVLLATKPVGVVIAAAVGASLLPLLYNSCCGYGYGGDVIVVVLTFLLGNYHLVPVLSSCLCRCQWWRSLIVAVLVVAVGDVMSAIGVFGIGSIFVALEKSAGTVHVLPPYFFGTMFFYHGRREGEFRKKGVLLSLSSSLRALVRSNLVPSVQECQREFGTV